jgi:hypothetical protein
MTTQARVTILGSAVLAAGLALATADRGVAADDKKTAVAATLRLAKALEDKDEAAAKKELDLIAMKGSLDEVMHLFALRSKGGAGVGETPGAITPDGIEAKILNLSKGKKPIPEATLKKEGDALAKAGYISAALAEVALKFRPEKKEGNKDPKDWDTWSKDMKVAGLELAEAAKAKKPKETKEAVNKLNASCNNCHGVFRDS